MKPPKKNPAAQALARLSRLNPTEAQKAASRRNGLLGAEHGKKGGRPKKIAATDLLPLLKKVHNSLIGIPQFDHGYQIDENDDQCFQICIGRDEGDTRPMADAEIRSMYPAIWARRKLAEMILVIKGKPVPAKKKGRKP